MLRYSRQAHLRSDSRTFFHAIFDNAHFNAQMMSLSIKLSELNSEFEILYFLAFFA